MLIRLLGTVFVYHKLLCTLPSNLNIFFYLEHTAIYMYNFNQLLCTFIFFFFFLCGLNIIYYDVNNLGLMQGVFILRRNDLMFLKWNLQFHFQLFIYVHKEYVI